MQVLFDRNRNLQITKAPFEGRAQQFQLSGRIIWLQDRHKHTEETFSSKQAHLQKSVFLTFGITWIGDP